MPNVRPTVFFLSKERNAIYFSYQIQQVRDLKVFTCETREQNKIHLLAFKQRVVYRFQLDGLLLFLFDSAKKCVFVHTDEIPKPHSLRSPLPCHPISTFPCKTLETITTLQKTYDILFKI